MKCSKDYLTVFKINKFSEADIERDLMISLK